MGTRAELRVRHDDSAVYVYRYDDGHPYNISHDLYRIIDVTSVDDPAKLATLLIAQNAAQTAIMENLCSRSERADGQSVKKHESDLITRVRSPSYGFAPKTVHESEENVHLDYMYDVVFEAEGGWLFRVSERGYFGEAGESFDEMTWNFEGTIEKAVEMYDEPPSYY